MTQSTHPPAPWEIHGATNVTAGDAYYICELNVAKLGFDQAAANARLIAAAPDMLKVLESTLDWIIDEVEDTTQGRALYQSDIMDAIAKAKGQE